MSAFQDHPYTAARRNVLLAGREKEESFLKLEEILAADYEVFFVSFDELIETLEKRSFDVMILDLRQTQGKKLLKKLKEDRRFAGLPVLLLSDDARMEERYHYLGADDMILLPLFSHGILLGKVKRALLKADGQYVKETGLTYEKDNGEKRFIDRLLKDFDAALEKEEFEVYYQPKFNIKEKDPVLTSAEALVRWKHSSLGMISPGIFIPLFEEHDLISRLDAYVWRKAAMQIAAWKKEKKISIPVSVNVSRKDLLKEGMVAYLDELVKKTGIFYDELLLEITESAYMEDPERIIEKIDALRDLGFLIEMDDFGTGYSSLLMVSRLPIDALKIDMCFIKDAFKEKKDTGMIGIILQIAKYLNVLSIAEGVEDQLQMDDLKKLGCDIVQGYYFSKPVLAKEFERFLEEKLELLQETEAK
ncbi:MAG: EAL domain-containing protein [Erysipelotrichaceae bacterium]|nr:EAL domain-containing protein [Erysipelotrichaceae bacterium]